MKQKAKQPEPPCSGCGKRTREECGLVDCANRKQLTAGFDPRAYESSAGGCHRRRAQLEKDEP